MSKTTQELQMIAKISNVLSDLLIPQLPELEINISRNALTAMDWYGIKKKTYPIHEILDKLYGRGTLPEFVAALRKSHNLRAIDVIRAMDETGMFSAESSQQRGVSDRRFPPTGEVVAAGGLYQYFYRSGELTTDKRRRSEDLRNRLEVFFDDRAIRRACTESLIADDCNAIDTSSCAHLDGAGFLKQSFELGLTDEQFRLTVGAINSVGAELSSKMEELLNEDKTVRMASRLEKSETGSEQYTFLEKVMAGYDDVNIKNISDVLSASGYNTVMKVTILSEVQDWDKVPNLDPSDASMLKHAFAKYIAGLPR